MITVVLTTGQHVTVPAATTATVRTLSGTKSEALACMDGRNQLVAAFKWEQVLGYVISEDLAQHRDRGPADGASAAHPADGWPAIEAPAWSRDPQARG